MNCSGWPRLEGTERLDDKGTILPPESIAVAGPDWRGLKATPGMWMRAQVKIAVAGPDWRGLKDRTARTRTIGRTDCSGWPRLEGTERPATLKTGGNTKGIAVAGPDWRGLKVARRIFCVAHSLLLQWLAPIGGD